MNYFGESVEGTVGSVNDVSHFQLRAKQSLSLARFRTVILKIPDVSQHFCYLVCGILRTVYSPFLEFNPLHQDRSTRGCLLESVFSLKWVNVMHRSTVMALGLILSPPPANHEALEKSWSFLCLYLSVDDTVFLSVHGCPLNFKFPTRGRVDMAWIRVYMDVSARVCFRG